MKQLAHDTDLPFHPLANLFPLIEDKDFADFVDDIRSKGVRDPILLFEGQILDGRNRYRAVKALIEGGSTDIKLPFDEFDEEKDGKPLEYVISKNLRRRHLTESQRAYVAAKLANMSQGRPEKPANLPVLSEAPEASTELPMIDQATAAEMLSVSERSVRSAKRVQEQGVTELKEAVEHGEIAVSKAEKIAKLPQAEQKEEVAKFSSSSRATMAQRKEPADSLDFFPTPPWATRALLEMVLPTLGVIPDEAGIGSIWEPACGEGHMSGVLEEYTPNVLATDIFDYSANGRSAARWDGVLDFLQDNSGSPPTAQGKADWVITNPPYNGRAVEFVLRGLARSNVGVAMFVPLNFVDSQNRYERLFRDTPPTMMVFFSERVKVCKGRWEPDGSTASIYVWMVWKHGEKPRAPMWLPPVCKETLMRESDRERFTAHPVLEMPISAAAAADDAAFGIRYGDENRMVKTLSGNSVAAAYLTTEEREEIVAFRQLNSNGLHEKSLPLDEQTKRGTASETGSSEGGGLELAPDASKSTQTTATDATAGENAIDERSGESTDNSPGNDNPEVVTLEGREKPSAEPKEGFLSKLSRAIIGAPKESQAKVHDETEAGSVADPLGCEECQVQTADAECASRPAGGRSPAATSEGMDATSGGGEQPSTSNYTGDPKGVANFLVDHGWRGNIKRVIEDDDLEIPAFLRRGHPECNLGKEHEAAK